MKKKLLSLLLSFTLLLTMMPMAFAEDSPVRETDFFTDQTHTDQDYTDLEYIHIELQPILDKIQDTQALLADDSNALKAMTEFLDISDQLRDLDTMDALASIRHSRDVMDEEAAQELAYIEAACNEAADAFSQLLREALLSPCASVFSADLTEEDIEYYTSYTAMTEEQLSMLQKERDLETRYEQAAAGITVEHQGIEWTDDSAYYAYTMGTLDLEGYEAISQAYVEKQNAVLGAIYLELAALRQDFAKSCGYDNYADYAYEEIYNRDYTPEDIRAFHQAVKDGGFYGISDTLYQLAFADPDLDVYYGDYANEETIDLVEGFMGQMSSELAESYGFMHSHGFYDIEEAAYKDGSAYTTVLASYGAPFFFSTPTGFFADFMRIVHEFGHYNESYWCFDILAGDSKSIDLAEVHSQGLELLFTHWYDDIFGESAQFAQDVLMMYLIQSICDGSLYDELQQYVYTTDDLTLEKINRKYRQLCGEYGMVDQDDPREEMYSWVQINHNFTSPCYYISYAVSAAGAFDFWLSAQNGDYFDAVDQYLRFTALPDTNTFQESFEALDMDNPLSPEYLSELSGALQEAMRLEERTASPMMPADLSENAWFFDIAYELYLAGLVDGDSAGRIRPYAPALWDDAAVLLSDLTRIPGALDGGAPITRLQFVRVMADIFDLEGSDAAPFSDTTDPVVAFLAENDVISGYADGTFRPDNIMTRAEMWVIFYRILMFEAEQLIVGFAA